LIVGNVFENLKSLKKDMESKRWIITAFDFVYKSVRYIVLVKLYGVKELRPKYSLLKLEFLEADDFQEKLEAPANSNGLLATAKELRTFFRIEYSRNLGNILLQFDKQLAKFVPIKVNDNLTKNQASAVVVSLSHSDSEDPNKKYCYAVKRNPINSNGVLGKRSSFIDNKTRILRRTLYSFFKEDKNMSATVVKCWKIPIRKCRFSNIFFTVK
jgi:hypothetical protein